MLREENNKPVPSRPMPKPIPMPRREYEYPEYESPKYERPDYDYPMRPDYPTMPDCPVMPDYPNNMNPCPYPYSDYDMYGDREMNLDEMMRRNPALKRCVMDCVERHNNRYPCRPMPYESPYESYNPCTPMPRPTPRPRRNPCRCNDHDIYSSYGSYKVQDYSYGGEMETYDFSGDIVENLSEDLSKSDIENKEE